MQLEDEIFWLLHLIENLSYLLGCRAVAKYRITKYSNNKCNKANKMKSVSGFTPQLSNLNFAPEMQRKMSF